MRYILAILAVMMPTVGMAVTNNSVPGPPVMICNPDSPSNCIKPNSDGSISVGGGNTVVTTADPNNASYQTAGTPVASGTLPLPVGMPAGKTARGIQYNCDNTAVSGTFTTLTLSAGGTLPFYVAPSYGANEGMSAISVTAVTGCTFQALY